jgi:sulfatase modifying factor 1
MCNPRELAALLAVFSVGCGGRVLDASGGSTHDVVAPTSGLSPDAATGDSRDAAAGDLAQAATTAAPASAGSGADPGALPNCRPGGPGLTDCGANHESCCTSLEVAGGTFFRAYDPLNDAGAPSLTPDGGPAGLAAPATVSAFRLDTYDVTVGRFRQFVRAWNGGAGWKPPSGSGKHTHLNGGQGLVSGEVAYEPGWIASDDANIAPTDYNLSACAILSPWTPSPGPNEDLPPVCVNWYEAYAFCIWDGGFLPTQTEWQYATAGGAEQREYPWGSADPGTASEYAIYGNYYKSEIAPVGTAADGVGLWGQLDLVGNVAQWMLDGDARYLASCTDCAYLASANRVGRGGYYQGPASYLLATYTDPGVKPANRGLGTGFRCARAP